MVGKLNTLILKHLKKFMNNERYNQIIDEAYKNYLKKGQQEANTDKENKTFLPLPKEQFINKCKTDAKFSERWGLKIEERKLSLGERGEIFRKEYPNKSVDDFAPGGMEVQSLNHQLNTRYNNANIPTKLLTVTYKNEIIEVYE